MRLAENAIPRILCLAVKLALGIVNGPAKLKYSELVILAGGDHVSL